MSTARVKAEKTAFASGEIAKTLYAKRDLQRHQTGVRRAENVVVLVESGLARRPGTRMVMPLKDETQRSGFIPFRYTPLDSYLLTLNGGKARFVKDGGFLGDPYEIDIPWTESDLDKLRTTPDNDTIVAVCDGVQPKAIRRLANMNWQISDYESVNGPVKKQNTDTSITLSASAVIGEINLLASADVFAAGDQGGVWRLDQPDLSAIAPWSANESITLAEAKQSGGTNYGNMTGGGGLTVAFDGNTSQTRAAGARYTNSESAQWPILGKNYTGDRRRVAKVKIFGPSDGKYSNSAVEEIRLYAKNGSAPANEYDGIQLGKKPSFKVSSGDVSEIFSSDQNTFWDYIWITFAGLSGPDTWSIAELEIYSPSVAVSTLQRRYNGNIYQALNNGNTGVTPPTHTEGDMISAATGGIMWRFINKGYGFVRITGVTDARNAAGTVLSRLPDSIVSVSTYRFWPGAWSANEGWPNRIGRHQSRLMFGRGPDFWGTSSLDIFDHEPIVDEPDSAFSGRLKSDDGSLVEIEWLLTSGVLAIGVRDGEWMLRTQNVGEALNATNILPEPDGTEGSATHVPARVDGGAVFIGRSRDRLHYVEFDRLTNRLSPDEITISSKHMWKKVRKLVWQRNPNRVLWVIDDDGNLYSISFLPKEKINGPCRHPMKNGFVEDIGIIPSSDGTRDDLYLSVRRTINAATRRFVEVMQPFFRPLDDNNPTAEGAWFVDCGLQYSGTPTTEISGLEHLIGEEVAVFADGAEQHRKTVSNDGKVTLDRAGSNVVVGIPIRGYVRSLPIDLDLPTGSTKGSKKRANNIVVDMADSAGGEVSVNAGEPEPLMLTGDSVPGQPIKLDTAAREYTVESPIEDTCEVEIILDNALPFTLTGLTPTLEVTG